MNEVECILEICISWFYVFTISLHIGTQVNKVYFFILLLVCVRNYVSKELCWVGFVGGVYCYIVWKKLN